MRSGSVEARRFVAARAGDVKKQGSSPPTCSPSTWGAPTSWP